MSEKHYKRELHYKNHASNLKLKPKLIKER